MGDLTSWIEDTLESLTCATITISDEIAAAAYELPGTFHKDPADRLLVATARLHELELVTADSRLDSQLSPCQDSGCTPLTASLDNSRVSEAKGRKHRSDKALHPRAPQS